MRSFSISVGLTLLIFIVCLSVNSAQKVDCRKHIFAPKCRGISAKRGIEPRTFPNDPTFRHETEMDQTGSEYAMRDESSLPIDPYPLTDVDRSDYSNYNPMRPFVKDDYRTSSILENRLIRALIRALMDRNSGEWEV